MENQSFDLSESTVLLFTTESKQDSTSDNKVLCRYLRPSTQTCINHNCNKNTFLCQYTECQCRKQHPQCMNINTHDLMIKNTFVIFFKKIKIIISLILLELQEKYRPILKKIPKHTSFIHKAVLLNDRFRETKTKIQSKIQGFKEKVQSILQRPRFFSTQSSKNQGLKKFITSTLDSKIATSVEEIEKLLHFFTPLKLKSFELLYRESDNYFSTEKFHEKCSYIPDTLILVETQYGKKIEGYTPIEWGRSPGKSVKDKSERSFTFSLTNGDKFELVHKDIAVIHHQNLI